VEFTKFSENYELCSARGQEGKWTLIGVSKHRKNCEIKFQPRYPQGHDYHSIMILMDEIEKNTGRLFTTSEEFRLWSYCSPREIGYADSNLEAKKLIEMLVEGDGELMDHEQQLLDGGFDFVNENEIITGEILPNRIFQHRETTQLRVTVGDDVHCDYSTGLRRYNLMQLFGDRRDNLLIIPKVYPESIIDFRKVWMVEERIARKAVSKKIFYLPL
jgi:hypothetical protein